MPFINFADSITCHGTKYVVEQGGEGSRNYMSGYEAAQRYANNPDNKHVKTIDYRSCYSGRGGRKGKNSNAQVMADATGAQVTGYTGLYSANPASCSASKVFSPQSDADAAASALRNVQGYEKVVPTLLPRTF